MKHLVLLLLCLLISGCWRAEAPQSLDERARLEKLREELRQTLGAKYDEPVPAATPAQLKRGAQLFADLCVGCHGVLGNGKPDHPDVLLQKPSDFTDKAQATFFSEQARLQILRTGIRGTAMMGWSEVLSESDLVAIYTYVRFLYKHE